MLQLPEIQALTTLSRDGRLLFTTRMVRLFAYGFLAVVLGLYLATVGLSDTQIGLVQGGDRVLGLAPVGDGDVFKLDEIVLAHAALSVGRAGTRVMDVMLWSTLRGAGAGIC